MSTDRQRGGHRRPRARRVAALLSLWLGTLLAAAVVWAPRASSASTASEDFTVVQTLPVAPDFTVGSAAVDDRAGIIYQIGRVATGEGAVQRVSARTYTLMGQPILLPNQGTSLVSARTVAVDQDRHRLFVGASWTGGEGIFVVDGSRGTIENGGKPIVPTVAATTQVGFSPTGTTMSYDAASGRIYLYGTLIVPAPTGSLPGLLLYVAAINPDAGVVDWTYRLDGCEIPAGQSFGDQPVVFEDSLWVFCTGQTVGPAAAQPELTQGLWRIQLAGGLPPQAPGTGVTIYPVPGFYQLGGGAMVGDAVGHRVMFFSPFPGPVNATVFDLPTGRVQGLMGINTSAAPNSSCVDARTGRVYVAAPFNGNQRPASQDYGFLVGEARATGSPYPQLRGDPDWAGLPAFTVAACVPSQRQVIVRQGSTMWVLQDNVPLYAPPPPLDDPDELTTGGPYDPATSTLSFQGDGRGFGAQVKLVGGYNAAGSAFVGGGLPAVVLSPSSPVLTLGASGLPSSPQNVSLSDTQSTSAAQGVSRDGGLQSDLAIPGGALGQAQSEGGGGPPPPDEVMDPWLHPIIACAASPGDRAVSQEDVGSAVRCDPDRYRSTASADTSDPVEIPGVLRIVGAGSSVTTELDKDTGVLTTISKGWTRALSLGDGQIEIDNVVAEAITQAGGQPGTAKATYTRTIGQLVINGETQCAPCDPMQVANAINLSPFTETTFRVVVPEPAGALPGNTDHQRYELPGTPKGAQAEVVRNEDEQLEDQAINELSPYDREVPALRFEVQNNSFKHPDLMIDLAAPQAYSRLQILPGDAPLVEETTTTRAPAELVPTTLPEATVAEQLPAAVPVPEPVADPPEPTGPPPSATGFSPSLVSFVPPAPPSVPDVIATPSVIDAGPSVPPVMPGVLGTVESGLRAAFASPSRFFALFLVWGVMAIPVYLASRRRLIVDFILGTPEVS